MATPQARIPHAILSVIQSLGFTLSMYVCLRRDERTEQNDSRSSERCYLSLPSMVPRRRQPPPDCWRCRLRPSTFQSFSTRDGSEVIPSGQDTDNAEGGAHAEFAPTVAAEGANVQRRSFIRSLSAGLAAYPGL